MKLLLAPIFGGSGVGTPTGEHYFLPETKVCIWNRAFPHQPDGAYVKFQTENNPLMIGDLVPIKYEGKIYDRKITVSGKHYEQYEITHDGFGNKPSYLFAGDLKKIPFVDFSGNSSDKIFEENFSINYLKSLPDEIKVVLLFFL